MHEPVRISKPTPCNTRNDFKFKSLRPLKPFADFVSSEFPTSAVLRLSLELKDQTKGHLSSLELTCRASTFLALPIFGFAFQYSTGSVHHLPLGTVLSQGPLQTNYGQLSRIRKLGAEAERSLELKPSHYITHVSCTVLLMNSNDWINKTLALPIESPVTKGNALSN